MRHPGPQTPPSLDAVIVGAGVVGAACAYYATRAGLSVAVVDRGPVAGGTTGAGEGNLLVSDKEAGPELDLARLSIRLWRELAEALPPEDAIEYEPKGGLVIAPDETALHALHAFARGQRRAGVTAHEVPADALHALEPHLAPGLAGGVHYPADAQVQPARAAAALLRAARRAGALLRLGEEVTAVLTGPGGAVRGVRTARGDLHAPAVVNAAGTWGGRFAALAGTHLPVLPRRGFVLVTEPLPPGTVRHKVYAADYVTDVASDSAALQSSAVVESTPAGPVLIGATRERVGFDRTLSTPALRRLAAQATALFPALADVHAIRAYCGFRPYLPDHLPAVGPDPRVPGLHHACGHEGAGIGLAPATGLLVTAALTGAPPPLDPGPFRPDRFPPPDGPPPQAPPPRASPPQAGPPPPDGAS
ncbi:MULTISPECIES: NAD(P)/FAD-dependent oxidoreductase [Streptomyces]|uniref:FAD-dependent oxidoreductase n=2 Tax=Streptomyces TaxID=1883 RepID=A0A100Y7X8_9ACTN|nr:MULTISPECIES: FAD-dependent oxidoreductase [Streptomyces]KUH39343.1 FAD-dependent oxidoreductase [Streptomyces kanasensis]UUS33439.1 FAD-binding oxidoreductase [Streptomyces changanensis]